MNKHKENLLIFAEHYIRYGFYLLPLPHRQKAPLMKAWTSRASNNFDEVRGWINNGYPQRVDDKNLRSTGGLGIATGERSGVVVIDIDGETGKNTLAALEAERGRLPDTPMQISGGGGLHYFFKYFPCGNYVNKLAGIDIRADGGQIVAAPSIHPKGKAYEWLEGHDLDDLEIEECPAWLKQLLEGEKVKKIKTVDDCIPKGKRNSALTSMAGTMRKRGMTENAIFAALLETNRTQCNPPLSESEIHTIVVSIGKYPAGVETNTGFADYLPFEQSESLPHFPLDALPPITGDFIAFASESIQAPIDLVGSCVLGALEIACRGRYPIELPNGHVEQPCLYIAPIAPPSERKSGVITEAMRYLTGFEIDYNRQNDWRVAQSVSELKLLQGRIDETERRAIKEKDSLKRYDAEKDLKALNTELANFKRVEPLRLYGADVTPEKLAHILKSQGEMFALVSAEGGGLFENIGRYSDRGGLEIYLNGYSGDRVCVDRKTSESLVIDRPTLNIIAPVQPSVIRDLFSDRQKVGRGLLSRILFVKCQSWVGSRSATSKPIDEHIAKNYRNLCYNMLQAESNGNLVYCSEGFEVYSGFFDEVERQLKPDTGELSFMSEWAGKLHGQQTRLAGLLHCITAFERVESPLDSLINAEEARGAVMLARFFLAHAKAVYLEENEPVAIHNARYLWSRLKGLESINKGDLVRKTQGKQNFTLDESLTELIKRGYIRVETTLTGGRPSEKIMVNPESMA